MLHPSYTDLMEVVNSEAGEGQQPLVQSRYSIVLATAKRARQIIGGQEPLVKTRGKGIKPLSVGVDEMNDAKTKICTEEEYLCLEEEYRASVARKKEERIEQAKAELEKIQKEAEEKATKEAEGKAESAEENATEEEILVPEHQEEDVQTDEFEEVTEE